MRFVLLLSLVACTGKPPGGGPEPRATDGGRTTDGGGRTAATSEYGTDPVEVIRDGAPVVPVTGVALTNNAGVETVTILFDGNLPGHHVAYVVAPSDCGTGEKRWMDGEAFLEVRMYPATGHTEEGKPLVGSVDIAPGAVVLDVERTCDFEAVVTYVIGVSGKRPFATRELLDPQRLEVEFQP